MGLFEVSGANCRFRDFPPFHALSRIVLIELDHDVNISRKRNIFSIIVQSLALISSLPPEILSVKVEICRKNPMSRVT